MTIHAFSIGNNYVGTMSELSGCANDAKDVISTFKPWLSSNKTIINTKADRATIFKEGKKALERLDVGDLLILSNSSHGTRDKIGSKWHEAIVCADFELIYDEEFDSLLANRAEGSYVAVFSDSCYSGGLPRGGGFYERIYEAGEQPIAKPKSIPVTRCTRHKLVEKAPMKALRNVIYFSGCKETEYSYDAVFNGRPNGAMTYYLLKAFRERKQNTTFGDLFKKLAGRGGYLPSEDHPQTPTCLASQSNLRKSLKFFAE